MNENTNTIGGILKNIGGKAKKTVADFFAPKEETRVRDFVREVPGEVAGVGKEILKGFARFARSGGESLGSVPMGINEIVNPGTKYKVPIYEPDTIPGLGFLGSIESYQNQARREVGEGKGDVGTFLKSAGNIAIDEPVGVAFKPLGLAVGALAKSNVGNIAKEAIDGIAKSNKIREISGYLKTLGFSKEQAKHLTPDLKKANTAEEVKKIINYVDKADTLSGKEIVDNLKGLRMAGKEELTKYGMSPLGATHGMADLFTLNNKPVAAMSWSEGALAGFSIHPDYQRRGVASELLKKLADENGMLEVYDPNEKMVGVLNKIGKVSKPDGRGVVKVEITPDVLPNAIDTEKQFSEKYVAQHKDIRSKTREEKEAVKKSIIENGFKKDGFNANALPINRGQDMTKQMTIIEKRYGNKQGDFVYLLPKEGVIKGPSGFKNKGGWKPTDVEVVEIEYDGQPTWEAYRNQIAKKTANKVKVNPDFDKDKFFQGQVSKFKTYDNYMQNKYNGFAKASGLDKAGIDDETIKWVDDWLYAKPSVPSEKVVKQLEAYKPKKPTTLYSGNSIDKLNITRTEPTSFTADLDVAKQFGDAGRRDNPAIIRIENVNPEDIAVSINDLPKNVLKALGHDTSFAAAESEMVTGKTLSDFSKKYNVSISKDGGKTWETLATAKKVPAAKEISKMISDGQTFDEFGTPIVKTNGNKFQSLGDPIDNGGVWYHGTTAENKESILRNGINTKLNKKGFAEQPEAFYMADKTEAGMYGGDSNAVGIRVKKGAIVKTLSTSDAEWAETLGRSSGTEQVAKALQNLRTKGYDAINHGDEIEVLNPSKFEVFDPQKPKFRRVSPVATLKNNVDGKVIEIEDFGRKEFVPHLETYKGHDIVLAGQDIGVWDGKVLIRPALDDSKMKMNRVIVEDLNNTDTARKYIDWVIERKEARNEWKKKQEAKKIEFVDESSTYKEEK